MRSWGRMAKAVLLVVLGCVAWGALAASAPASSNSGASTQTNTFAPPTYVDYKGIGGEPTGVVDRYPFPGSGPNSNSPAFQCPSGQTSCYKDLVYVSAPEGLGTFSYVWKSDDLAQTFRLPPHVPIARPNQTIGEGGGDSHLSIGQVTHSVFMADLYGACITMNVSRDLGEHWTTDPLGCGSEPGAIDDRQWVETDETAGSQNVYVSFIDASPPVNIGAGRTLSLARSTTDGSPGSFANSPCNTLTSHATVASAATDNTPSACPDPRDPQLAVAGPIVADKEGTATRPPTHDLYIPFIRRKAGFESQLYIAKSRDEGNHWTRRLVADVGEHRARYLFPQLTIDRGGNLYFTWGQSTGNPHGPNLGGETDIFYAYSTTHGETWSPPIDLTKETGDSAVFPWMVAGDPGQVDLTFYRADTGINPDIAFVDANGNECDEGSPGCQPNTSTWDVYFAQSQNALNTGPNFKSVQVSDHPNHHGSICTLGTGCGSADRDLLDFFTLDVDHLGAAHVIWADDNNGGGFFARDKVGRQIAGQSVYSNTPINLQSTWPTKDHSAVDKPGDVVDPNGDPVGTCPGMDLLGASTERSGTILTVNLTLSGPPTIANATACSRGTAQGGVWGVEFWAQSTLEHPERAHNFYVAYADTIGDHGGEVGRMDNFAPGLTSLDYQRRGDATPGGNCLAASPPNGPCTLTITADLAQLGIPAGSALNSVTGLATFNQLTNLTPPLLRVKLGNSELGDATAAFEDTGTGNVNTK